jgi:hypothetical protein
VLDTTVGAVGDRAATERKPGDAVTVEGRALIVLERSFTSP